MVSVLRMRLNFLQTRATSASAGPGSREKISTKSSGGRSDNVCGCTGAVPARSGKPPLLTRPLPYSQASLGPAMAAAATLLLEPPSTSTCLWATIRSSSSSSISESLPWSCWLCGCRLRHLRDWPTPQSLAQTAIRDHRAGNITSLLHIDQLQSVGSPVLSSMGRNISSDVTSAHARSVVNAFFYPLLVVMLVFPFHYVITTCTDSGMHMLTMNLLSESKVQQVVCGLFLLLLFCSWTTHILNTHQNKFFYFFLFYISGFKC